MMIAAAAVRGRDFARRPRRGRCQSLGAGFASRVRGETARGAVEWVAAPLDTHLHVKQAGTCLLSCCTRMGAWNFACAAARTGVRPRDLELFMLPRMGEYDSEFESSQVKSLQVGPGQVSRQVRSSQVTSSHAKDV